MRFARSGLGVLAAASLGLLLAACGRGGESTELAHARLVKQVGEFQLDDAALERHIRYETGMRPEDLDPLGRARLGEELLAEALLARGAELEKLTPAADALAAEVARLQAVVGATAPGERLQDDARRRVLARLYERQILVPQVVVKEQDVERAAQIAGGAAGGEQVVFRQLRVDTEAAAQQAQRDILAGRAFDNLAAEVSTAPDRGRPLARSLSELPPAAAAALRGLREGGVSQPVNVDGAYYLFQLDARNAQADPSRSRDAVRKQLWERGFEELRRRRVAELAEREGVRAPIGAGPGEEQGR